MVKSAKFRNLLSNIAMNCVNKFGYIDPRRDDCSAEKSLGCTENGNPMTLVPARQETMVRIKPQEALSHVLGKKKMQRER